MRFFFLAFLFVLLFLSEKVQGQAVSWGDQGNGTYINPILNVTPANVSRKIGLRNILACPA